MRKYDVEFSDVAALQQQTDSCCYMLSRFCDRLGDWALSSLLLQFGKRVRTGAREDIADICEIKGIGAKRGRALYNAGIRSVSQIAHATPDKLCTSAGSCFPPGIAGRGVAEALIQRAKDVLGSRVKALQLAAEEVQFVPQEG